ncbi:hypothetical protein [uncultured Secundilactobacillus sp.]|uniref:hypothetical protein n=1 Tax=uncultured Secundilactobacillus sp. TaxID=2813935 RepID=UPI00259057B6|nr:hypothetical protein [uncultured Secundilactobacillus sp.]
MGQYRDLTLLKITPEKTLVIACDSSAGIGEKPLDSVKTSAEIVAAFSLRVPLLELLCYGATPLAVVDTLGNEMQPTGEAVIRGLKRELIRAGYDDLPINGSTEDNMVTQTTSVGVTVVAESVGQNMPNQIDEAAVYQIGVPYVGEDLQAHLDEVVSYETVRQIKQCPGVVDLIPVGSQGIAHEVAELARTNRLGYDSKQMDQPAYHQSAGPSTVVLALVSTRAIRHFEALFPTATPVIHLQAANH